MPRKPQPIDPRLLYKVSKLYYEHGLTQREIAERLFLSRPKISRLLQQARDEGIVQITIFSPANTYGYLEEKLEEKFGLLEAIVIESSNPDVQTITTREIGIAAADYLQRTVQDNQILGISWGSTLNTMVHALRPTDAHNLHVVQIIGGLGPPNADTHATFICSRMTQILNGKLTVLPAPGIVDHQDVKSALMTDRHVKAAFDMFSKIDVAFVGIGAPTPTSVVLRDGLIINQDDVDGLVAQGAVGDIALRFFNHQGHSMDSTIEKRVIGISIDELKQIKRVIGVSGGPEKTAAILAALLGGLTNVLITDHKTAENLLVAAAEEVRS
jgi:DNA-binding transcriptional regulator LsrR (DeoR family)